MSRVHDLLTPESSNLILFQTHDKKATSHTTYGTIGFVVTRCVRGMEPYHDYMDADGNSYNPDWIYPDEFIWFTLDDAALIEHTITDPLNSEMQYSQWELDVQWLLTRMEKLGFEDWIADINDMTAEDDLYIKVDSIMNTKIDGVPEAFLIGNQMEGASVKTVNGMPNPYIYSTENFVEWMNSYKNPIYGPDESMANTLPASQKNIDTSVNYIAASSDDETKLVRSMLSDTGFVEKYANAPTSKDKKSLVDEYSSLYVKIEEIQTPDYVEASPTMTEEEFKKKLSLATSEYERKVVFAQYFGVYPYEIKIETYFKKVDKDFMLTYGP